MYLENFKQLRKAKGLTLKGIADQLGLSKQALHKWEQSNVIPNEYAAKICSILEIDLEDQEFYNSDCIVELRKKLGIKQANFAALLEISHPTLNRWENGTVQLTEKNTLMLHQLYKKLSGDLKSPEVKAENEKAAEE